MDLQSGFVLAVVLAVVLIAKRVGGTDEVASRFYQVALGVTIALTVIAATTAFIQPDDDGSGVLISFQFGSDEEQQAALDDAVDVNVASATVQMIAGALVLLVGLGAMQRWSVVPLGVVLGGLLLMLAASGGGLSAYAEILDTSRGASEGLLFGNLIATVGALASLLWYGLSRLEPAMVDAVDEEEESRE